MAIGASTKKLSTQGTRFVKFRGNIQTWTQFNSPQDGQAGEIGYETTNNQIFIHNGTRWVGIGLTTSTSTSTTTT